MTHVYCENTDCEHYDVTSFMCKKDVITVGDSCFGGCDEYESFRDSIEYSARHYIAVRAYNTEGKLVPARAIRYGKKIEYNGVTFYTTDRTLDDSYRLTHERTGVDSGRMSMLKDRWEIFLEKEKELPDVESLPLAEYSGSGKYELVEEGAPDEQN